MNGSAAKRLPEIKSEDKFTQTSTIHAEKWQGHCYVFLGRT